MPRDTASRQRRLLGLALVIVMVGLAALASVLTAHDDVTSAAAGELSGVDPYLRRADGRHADPVNVVFINTSPVAVALAVEHVLGWQVVAGSPMSFTVNGREMPVALQLGLDIGGGARYHVRIEDTPPGERPGAVLAALHRDDSVTCGHVGRAFDEVRDNTARAFAAAGYPVSYLDLGNTERIRHCDGSLTGGDGRVAVIDLGQR